VANPLQDHYAAVLLQKISNDTHPSPTHMNMLEAVAPDTVLMAHILHLIERIENDPQPSIPMMRRVERLIAQFG
jgi:hypothetical protein